MAPESQFPAQRVSSCTRGIARILSKGVLDNVRKNLSHAHLLTGKVEVQIVTENVF